ncbi:MAG: ROK family transcriptional regulator [Spirochaetaceae bacterium]|nr:MAG: ROK family transcriptional regulator [Spirochaetaceae bacterium]
MKPISDHETMKRNNQLAILRAIRSLGPVSRVRLQKETNLSWGTITSSIKELLDKRVVKETGSVNTGVGRRPVELDMNTAEHFVVGVRLGSSYIRSIILDVKGNTAGEYKEFVDAGGSRESILQQLYQSVDSILGSTGVDLDTVAGIGIAAPGAIDARAGVCLYAPHHPNWKNVHLKESFEQRFGKPCFVDHVNNCTALGQMLFGQGKGIENFLCVLLGTGISAGIIINGEVYRGVNCAAGEFGHMCIDPSGPDCACGNRGCLEVYASGPALARMGREIADRDPASKIAALAGSSAEEILGETVFQAALEGDRGAVKLFEDMGFYLGIGISNLIDLFNPERVILCGRVSEAHRFFLPSLQRTVEERAWHISKKEIKVSSIPNAPVLGAAGNVLQGIYNGGLLFDTIQKRGMPDRGKLAV